MASPERHDDLHSVDHSESQLVIYEEGAEQQGERQGANRALNSQESSKKPEIEHLEWR